jgi:hypothetical protein
MKPNTSLPEYNQSLLNLIWWDMSCSLELFSTELCNAELKVIAHVQPNEVTRFSFNWVNAVCNVMKMLQCHFSTLFPLGLIFQVTFRMRFHLKILCKSLPFALKISQIKIIFNNVQ